MSRSVWSSSTRASSGRSGPEQDIPVTGFVYVLSRLLFRCCSKLWFRFSIQGRGRVPRSGPVILVPNHGSYLDPPLLGVATPRTVRFLAHRGLARWRPLAWWLRAVGVTLIDRTTPSKEVLRTLSRALANGSCIGLFAEGTRTEDGRVAPFRSGIQFLVRRTGAVVVPVGIEGSFRAFPRGARWIRPRKCRLRFGEPWAADRVLAPGGIEQLRRTVAELARALPSAAPAPASGATLPAAAGSEVAHQVGQGRGIPPADSTPSANEGTNISE